MTEFEMRNHLMQETAKRTYALRELNKQQTENRILEQQFEHEKEKNRRLYEEIEKLLRVSQEKETEFIEKIAELEEENKKLRDVLDIYVSDTYM